MALDLYNAHIHNAVWCCYMVGSKSSCDSSQVESSSFLIGHLSKLSKKKEENTKFPFFFLVRLAKEEEEEEEVGVRDVVVVASVAGYNKRGWK